MDYSRSMRAGHIPRRAFLFSVLSVLIFCGCAAAADAPSLSGVKKFDSYPVYYAGEQVFPNRGAVGLPLEKAGGSQSDRRSSNWVFIYGHCEPPPSGEAGCPPPLQIQNFSTCTRWAAGVNQGRRLYDFRGAKARGGGATGISDPLEIFTGSTTVVIFAERRSVTWAAAKALRNVRSVRPTGLLPPPVQDSLSGDLPCQDRSG